MKYPILIQDEQKACGVYCIAMILRYYGYKEEIKVIKKRTRLNQKGVSFLGIIECLKSYNIEAKAYEISLENLKEHLNQPGILFIENNGIGHFAVLYEIKNNIYIIGDPAVGLVRLKKEELNHYTSRCIMINHIGEVKTSHKDRYIDYLKSLYFSYRTLIISIVKKGLLISVLGYISSLFFKYVIDYINADSSYFIVISGICIYISIEIIKGCIYYIKNKNIISLKYYMDDDLVRDNINRVIDDYEDYDNIGYCHSELISLFDLSEMTRYLIENIFIDGISIIVFMIGMYFINRLMFFIVLLLFISIICISLNLLKKMKKIQKNYQEAYYQYSSHIYTILKSIRFIHSFNLTDKYRTDHSKYFMSFQRYKILRSEKNNELNLINHILMSIYLMVIMFVGFYQYFHNQLSLGMLFMFYTLMTYCITPLINNIALYEDYQHMCFLYEKYKKYNNQYSLSARLINTKITSIVFDHIQYSYGYGIPIIEHLDWNITQSTLLKGETGSGKSTLLRLLLGYDYDYIGDIYINDMELRTIDLKSLYNRIIYIDEKPVFIEGSLYENFLCEDAERINQLLDYFNISELKNSYDILLDVEGNPLSLGQRQIVSLIRSLLSKKDVYIFDEAFSHMDDKLRERVYTYLEETKDQSIYIIVDHQINLMNINFDCVIMNGKRIESTR